MANQHPIHPLGRNGSPFAGHNPNQLPVELSRQRRLAGGTCEESAGEQEHAPQWEPSSAGKLKREQIALWLFIVAVAIISLVAAYLLWAKLSLRSPS
jgi:type VI protein secretion system component VasF